MMDIIHQYHLQHILEGHTHEINCAQFSEDAAFLATGGEYYQYLR